MRQDTGFRHVSFQEEIHACNMFQFCNWPTMLFCMRGLKAEKESRNCNDVYGFVQLQEIWFRKIVLGTNT